MLNRRAFLKSLGAAAAGVALPWKPSDSLKKRVFSRICGSREAIYPGSQP